MIGQQDSKQSPLLFSCCSGYDFYYLDNRGTCEVFGKKKDIIKHVKTGAYFYYERFPTDFEEGFNLDYWVNLVRKPVALKHYLWPVDVIAWPINDRSVHALVFPIRTLPPLRAAIELFKDDMKAGWDKPWVKCLVSNLLEAWCSFDSQNYAYHEVSPLNLHYQSSDYSVMFDFSFSTQKVDGLFDTCHIDRERVMPDYADSYFYRAERGSLMDLASDYYSIAVMLFKLLIGRLPYQGKVMEHEPDTNEREHRNWLEVYHRNTFFIFDEQDDTNHIGGESGFAKDEVFVERYQALSPEVQMMFRQVFKGDNVLRKASELVFYSPQEWKEALFPADGKALQLNIRAGDSGNAPAIT
jgi:hypothetical protein